jgi:predicted DNA-binding transcriptional regulator YafY
MAIDTYFERIFRIDRLIRLKATGSPADLAQRLEISESGLYRYISYMRLMGAPIIFCKYRNSYMYEDNGKFQIGFMVTPIKQDEFTNTF